MVRLSSVGFVALLAMGCALLISPEPAKAQILSHILRSRALPECDNRWVERKIAHRFAAAERQTWHHGVALGELYDIHQKRMIVADRHGIDRRFCRASSEMSDGRKRTVHFLIEQGMGYAGYSWNVEYCIAAFEPWKTYDGRCRSIR